MFHAIQTMPIGYVLCGIIWSVALGFAVGNYACSLVHRLPRGRLILDKKPYCGHCGTLLQVKDLFPVISAVLLKHRCRYCGTPFPVSHTWTEILVGLLFTLCFFQYNYGQQFLLISAIGVFLIVLAAIHANEGVIMGKVVLCVVVFGMLYRTLADGNIYNFFVGGLYGLIAGAALWHKQIKPAGHVYTLPKPVELLAVGGICVGADALLQFFMLYAVLYIVFRFIGALRKKRVPYTVSFGFAVTLLVLYPQMHLISAAF